MFPDVYSFYVEPKLNERVITREQYEAAKAKSLIDECATCGVSFEWQIETPTAPDSRRTFCSQRCYDMGIAILNPVKPAGDTYGCFDI